MTPPPAKEFGKRRPPDELPVEQKKRSGHVALLLMGTMAIGGGAYALMPRENCDPNRPPLSSDQPADCRQSSSSGGHGGSGGSSSRGNGSASADAGHVTRSGFGSFMSHFSGGG